MSQRFALLYLGLLQAVAPVSSSSSSRPYKRTEQYMEDFFGKFDFWTMPDPTHGVTDYVGPFAQAAAEGLVAQVPEGVYMGPELRTSLLDEKGSRKSVRLQSKNTYNGGLFVISVAHIPTGCGAWPAFWMYGEDEEHIWPKWGEIDIIEGIHVDSATASTLHTGPGCNQTSVGENQFSGKWSTNTPSGEKASDCYVNAPGQWGNQGCSIVGPNRSMGGGFNDNGGGTFATEWNPEAEFIRIWFWKQGHEPFDLVMGEPKPSSWGAPYAFFSLAPTVCPISSFKNMRLVFDITFCGDYGNPTFDNQCAASGPLAPGERSQLEVPLTRRKRELEQLLPQSQSGKRSVLRPFGEKRAKETKLSTTCEDFVRTRGDLLSESYWIVRALDVYQKEKAHGSYDGAEGIVMPTIAETSNPSSSSAVSASSSSRLTTAAPTTTAAPVTLSSISASTNIPEGVQRSSSSPSTYTTTASSTQLFDYMIAEAPTEAPKTHSSIDDSPLGQDVKDESAKLRGMMNIMVASIVLTGVCCTVWATGLSSFSAEKLLQDSPLTGPSGEMARKVLSCQPNYSQVRMNSADSLEGMQEAGDNLQQISEEPAEICTYYVNGVCKLGQRCKFKHSQGRKPEDLQGSRSPKTVSPQDEEPRESRQVPACLSFQKTGFCVQGDQCAYVHAVAPPSSPAESLPQRGASRAGLLGQGKVDSRTIRAAATVRGEREPLRAVNPTPRGEAPSRMWPSSPSTSSSQTHSPAQSRSPASQPALRSPAQLEQSHSTTRSPAQLQPPQQAPQSPAQVQSRQLQLTVASPPSAELYKQHMQQHTQQQQQQTQQMARQHQQLQQQRLSAESRSPSPSRNRASSKERGAGTPTRLALPRMWPTSPQAGSQPAAGSPEGSHSPGSLRPPRTTLTP